MDDKPKVNITGIAYFDNTRTPNEMSGKFQIEIGQLSDEEVAKLQALGINIKTQTPEQIERSGVDKGRFVTSKSKYAAAVVDGDNNPLSADTYIGNGSTVEVNNDVYQFTKPYNGFGLGLNAVQVIDYVQPLSSGSSEATPRFTTKEGAYKVDANAPADAIGGDADVG